MELTILYALQKIHNRLLTPIMVFFTHLGDGGILWIGSAIIFICIKKYKNCGITMLVALLISVLLGNVLLKNIFARKRPCWIDPEVLLKIKNPPDFSFPSGHTLASFSAAVTVYMHDRKIGVAALVIAGVIAFSRLYLFVHYPTDVIASVALGVGVAIIASVLVRKYY